MGHLSKEHTKSVIAVSINEAIFKRSTELSKTHLKLMSTIESGDWEGIDLTEGERYCAIFLYLASVTSLICRKEVLVAIIEQVLREEVALHYTGGGYHLEVTPVTTNMGGNSNDGEKRTSLIRCYLEPMTLSALHCLLKSPQDMAKKAVDTESRVKQLLNKLITFLGGTKFSSLSSFCSTAAELGGRLANISLPSFLNDCATGSNITHSMPLNCLQLHYNQRTKTEFNIKPLARVSKKRPRRHRGTNELKIEVIKQEPIAFFERLKSILSVDRSKDKGNEHQRIISILERMLSSETNMTYSQEIMKDEPDNENKSYRLRDLIIYSVEYCELTPPDDPFYSVTDISRYVRSAVISERIIAQLKRDLLNFFSSHGHYEQQTMIALFIILSRTGLRPAELVRLRVCDVEISKEGWIFVRPHGEDKLKNTGSKRKVPYGKLLQKDERVAFEIYANLRKQQTVGEKKAYLFTKSSITNEPFVVRELEEVIGQRVSNYMGFPVPVYQFRHTVMTNLTVIAFGSEQLISEMTAYGQKQAEEIKRCLVGQRNRDKLWAISAVAGHQTPRTTLFSYVHCCDILLHERLLKANYKGTARFWLNLSSLPARAINNIRNDGFEKEVNQQNDIKKSDWKIAAEEVKELLYKKVYAFAHNSSVKDTRKFDERDITLPAVKPDMQQCYITLNKYDAGVSLNNILLESIVDEVTVKAWIEAAKQVANRYRTNQNKCRLVSHENKICPHKPRADEGDLGLIFSNLKSLYQKKPNELYNCIEYTLNNVTNQNSFITFNCADKFKDYIATCVKLAPAERWHLDLQLGWGEQDKEEAWISVGNINSSVKVVDTKTTEIGRLRLLTDNLSKTKKQSLQSSRAIRYLFHMAEIMNVAEKLKKGS